MKIYNFGNDYAFQQKQKMEQEAPKMNPSSENKVKEESNVENQNSDAGLDNVPGISEKSETAKKKKEAGTKGREKQEDSQVQ